MSEFAGQVELRECIDDDFEAMFRISQDPVANEMSMVYPLSREQFEDRWRRTNKSAREIARTILFNGEIVGKINSFPVEDELHIGYFVAQAHWGNGIGTRALRLIVDLVETRPLIAHAAKSNIGSCRVLEKCGFVKIDERDSPDTERYRACVEAVYELP